MTERVHLYNPANREVTVDIDLVLDKGAVEPIEVTVGPRGQLTVPINETAEVPRGVGHSLVVTALDGDPIVAARTLDGATGARTGRGGGPGLTRAARRWVFGGGAATTGVDEWIAIQAPDERDVTVEVWAMAEGRRVRLSGMESLTIEGLGRRSIRINDVLERAEVSIVVEASRPIFAERALYRTGRYGMSISQGVALD